MRRDMTHNPFDHPSLYTRYIASSVRANPTNTRLVIACYLVMEKDSDFSLPAIFCVSNQTCSAISRERNVGTLTKYKNLLFSKRKSTDFAIDNKNIQRETSCLHFWIRRSENRRWQFVQGNEKTVDECKYTEIYWNLSHRWEIDITRKRRKSIFPTIERFLTNPLVRGINSINFSSARRPCLPDELLIFCILLISAEIRGRQQFITPGRQMENFHFGDNRIRI